MNNKTQAIIGVVALGAIGLYLWNNRSKKDKVFANAGGLMLSDISPRPKSRRCPSGQVKCPNNNKCYENKCYKNKWN